MLNRIVLIGRLTKDVDLRSTQNGASVATFTLAVDRAFSKDKETDFIPVVVWRAQAESCAKYLSKGKLSAVDGRLQIRTYEANDGSKRTIAEVVADAVRFLSPKGEQMEARNNEVEETIPLDELPF